MQKSWEETNISTRSRYFRRTKVCCKDALSYVSSSVTSLMFQLVIMVIISLLFALYTSLPAARLVGGNDNWKWHQSRGAPIKVPRRITEIPLLWLWSLLPDICVLQNTFQTVRHYFSSIDTVSRCWNNGSLCFPSMLIYRSYFYLGWSRLATMSRVCEV